MSYLSSATSSVVLPNGQDLMVQVNYTMSQARAVQTLIAVSSFSAASVIALLIVIFICAFQSIRANVEGLFIRSHVAAYFFSLLLTDLLQAVGSLLNVKWVNEMSVEHGGFCTAQGVIKMAADVGTATWTLAIAIHTFNVLFLHVHVGRVGLCMTLIAGWSFIIIMVMLGPAALNTQRNGPFYGISGYWCWITNGYPISRIVLSQDYMILFISAIVSFILYTLVFLRLRGNIVLRDGCMSFVRVTPDTAWQAQSRQNPSDTRIITITKQMLLYPIAYTILIVPIATVRFATWMGHEVPFAVVIFSDAVFLLSGFVNALLFITTRRILPFQDLVPSCLRRAARETKVRDNQNRPGDPNESFWCPAETVIDKPQPADADEKGEDSSHPPLRRHPALTRQPSQTRTPNLNPGPDIPHGGHESQIARPQLTSRPHSGNDEYHQFVPLTPRTPMRGSVGSDWDTDGLTISSYYSSAPLIASPAADVGLGSGGRRSFVRSSGLEPRRIDAAVQQGWEPATSGRIV